MKRFWLILAAMLGLAVSAMPASAAIQYTLNCNGAAANCTGANANFNFGTVTLSNNGGGSVDVTVVLAAGYRFVEGSGTMAFLWNDTGTGNQNLTTLSGGFNSTGTNANSAYTAGASGYLNTGGTGFDHMVTRQNSNTQTSLSFDVTKSGGLTLANFNEGNNDNAGVYFFAARIYDTATSTVRWVASNKAGVDIPEPATWLLFFAALAGLTVLYRRRQLARA